MMPELPCAIEQRLGTSADLANVDESAVRPKVILVASRGDAATVDPYAIDPARQLCQRKVFRIYAAPNARRPKRRATSGAKGLGRRTIGRGWPLSRSKDNAKSFWHQMGYLRAAPPPRC